MIIPSGRLELRLTGLFLLADFAEVPLGVAAILVVVALHEGLVFLAGDGFLGGNTRIDHFILDGVKSLGSGLLALFVSFFEGFFDLFAETFLGFVALAALAALAALSALTALATLSGIASESRASECQGSHQDRRQDQVLVHIFLRLFAYFPVLT
jgi:hypothetical protein